jgi:hypothetical protein
MNRPLRFLVGTFESSGMTSELSAGLSALGHESHTALCHGYSFFGERLYNFDVSRDANAVDWAQLARALERTPPPRRLTARSSSFERLHWMIAHHDVFVFLYTSLHHDRRRPAGRMGLGREFPLLKRLGKQIVAMFVGPEVRHASAYDQELRSLGGPGAPLASLFPNWSSTPVRQPLRNVRRAELWADVILSQPNQAGLALRPYTHFFVPIDLANVRAEIPKRDVPVVLHAPSQTGIKGTSLIVCALDALEREGVRFERKIVTDRPNREVLEEMSRADVVIDQVHLPLHGRLGVEAMASGCAVATCDRVDWEPFPEKRPIWHIDVDNLKEQLRRLFTDKPLRIELARAGRRHAERHHGHVAVARRIVDALERPDEAIDHRPTFFARHYRLPSGARVPRALRRMTAQVARRCGLPDGVTLRDLQARGLA